MPTDNKGDLLKVKESREMHEGLDDILSYGTSGVEHNLDFIEEHVHKNDDQLLML